MEIISFAEAARRAKVSLASVYRLTRKGKVATHRRRLGLLGTAGGVSSEDVAVIRALVQKRKAGK